MARQSVQKLIDEGSDALKMALSDMDGDYSPFTLDNDTLSSDFSYRWAIKDDNRHPAHVDKLKRVGYRVVNSENNSGEVAPFADVQTTQGGAIQTAEHVLMRIPMELYDARQSKIVELGKSRLSGYTDEAKESISRVGAIVKSD